MPPEPPAPALESLRAAYDALLAQITRGHGDGAALADVSTLVTGDERANAAERIHVYQHMYRARIVEALEAQYPRLARWLGADAFGEVVAAYVADEPSRHPSLRFIGRRFPDWLAARAPADARPAALADLARLEWAREDVFDAADQETLALDTVRGWPPERFGEIPLRLVTAHRVLRLARPVAALWDVIGPAAGALEEGALADAAASRRAGAGGETLLVWRQGIADLSPRHRRRRGIRGARPHDRGHDVWRGLRNPQPQCPGGRSGRASVRLARDLGHRRAPDRSVTI